MIIIALGANLISPAGPPRTTLMAALNALEKLGVKSEAVSRFYRTPAWPDPSDPPFVNAACAVSSLLNPENMLKVLHKVETQFARIRSGLPEERNRPRTLDIDLIDYDGIVQAGPPILPHPAMKARPFVLIPLRDIAPQWRHPESGESLAALIKALGSRAETPELLN